MSRGPNKLDLLDMIHHYDVDPKSRTIYVHSSLEPEEAGVDFRMASSFIKNLDHLNSVSSTDITVKMFSFGGDWNYGMAMYDAIKASNSPINFISYAHSRSMSSIIPQAATYRRINRHCDFMVHYGTYSDSGDFRQVMNGVKFYEKSNAVMLDIYAARCCKGKFAKEKKMDMAKMHEFIKGKIEELTDWWMTADEAVYYGFMDEVV